MELKDFDGRHMMVADLEEREQIGELIRKISRTISDAKAGPQHTSSALLNLLADAILFGEVVMGQKAETTVDNVTQGLHILIGEMRKRPEVMDPLHAISKDVEDDVKDIIMTEMETPPSTH